LGEMLTSHHEEKAAAGDTTRAYVRDFLR